MLSFKQYTLLEVYELEPGTQLGSNDGGIYYNNKTKQREYIKFPKSEGQAKVEAATADLYHQLGIQTLKPEVKIVQGKTAVVTPWNSNLETFRSPDEILKHAQDPVRAKQLALMHHAAIITGNRDIIGLGYDNVLRDKNTGDFVSVDQGGAMHYRAQGEPKPFDKSIEDVKSFQNPAYASGRVFGNMDPRHLKDAAQDLQKMSDDKIDSVMRNHRMDALGEVIKARRDMLIKHYRGI